MKKMILTLFSCSQLCGQSDLRSDAAIELKAYKAALEHCSFLPRGEVLCAKISLLARCERATEALALFEANQISFSEFTSNHLLEEICWSILRQGCKAPSQQEQATAFLGVALTQDAYAIPLLLQALNSPQWQIRALAAHFSEPFRDSELQKKTLKLLNDSSLKVRLAAIQSCSFPKAIPLLQEQLKKTPLFPQEEAVLLSTLAQLYKHPEVKQIQALLQSPHKTLRQLGARLALLCPQSQCFLEKSVADPCYEVKIQALVTLGLLGVANEEALALLNDPHPSLAITAAWYCQLQNKPQGEVKLLEWVNHCAPNIRRLAAAAIAKTRDSDLAFRCLSSSDPFVRATLAFGLINQRCYLPQASQSLADLLEVKSLLSVDEESHPLFKPFTTPSSQEEALSSKEERDLILRMELLNLLAIVHYPQMQEKLYAFLKGHPWTIRTQALEALLQETDHSAVAYVETLLEGPDRQLALQAALILTTFFSSPKAVTLLMSFYEGAPFESKILILETLGKLPVEEGQAFLQKALRSPSHTLRLAAATSLLRQLH